MRTDSLLAAAAAVGPGPLVQVRAFGKDEVIVQVDIAGASTVAIQGRVDSDMEWTTLQTVSVSSIVPIAAVAQIRANVTAHSSGTVTAKVQH